MTGADWDGGADFVKDLETVVYGCHKTSSETVKEVFDEEGVYTFSFSEYFLDAPVFLESDLERRCVYFPFLQRSAMELKYYVTSSGSDRSRFLAPKTRKLVIEARERGRTPIPLKEWPSLKKPISDYLASTAEDRELPGEELSISAIRGRRRECEGTDPWKVAMLSSYDLQLHLWLKTRISNRSPVRVVRSAIASRHSYYGHFVVVFHEVDTGRAEGIAGRVREYLNKLARRLYVPTLTLLHVSKWEKQLRAGLKKAISSSASNLDDRLRDVFPEISPTTLKWENSADEFESAFGRLWANRHALLEGLKSTGDEAKFTEGLSMVESSIILDKYHIASPSMVQQVRQVVRGATLMKEPRKGDSLPSALVFGEAGSGKDKMARLIGTLTTDFWDVEPSTHNMAALKPSLLAVPLMFGVKLDKWELPGLFDDADMPGVPSTATATMVGATRPKKRVLILDELNSLDYDMQGSLLRLLENGETAPLFKKGESGDVNALVVGVVNEDPEQVTRESELRLLEGAKDLLGQAEAARLYDALYKARRLRPDLVYRLKRGVYVRMPSLRDRREDIPLLFRHACADHLKALSKGGARVEFELDVYDLLMRPDFLWPGNIRQLQAVASKVANEVWSINEGAAEIFVRRREVERILRSEFKEMFRSDRWEE